MFLLPSKVLSPPWPCVEAVVNRDTWAKNLFTFQYFCAFDILIFMAAFIFLVTYYVSFYCVSFLFSVHDNIGPCTLLGIQRRVRGNLQSPMSIGVSTTVLLLIRSDYEWNFKAFVCWPPCFTIFKANVQPARSMVLRNFLHFKGWLTLMAFYSNLRCQQGITLLRQPNLVATASAAADWISEVYEEYHLILWCVLKYKWWSINKGFNLSLFI